jgi:serine/threonine-protein kinase
MPAVGAGPLIASGSKVVLVVSQGPADKPRAGAVATPDVVGKPQGEALESLQEAGLNAQIINDFSPSVRRGRVIGQFPIAGQMEAVNSEVILLISNGPAVETSQTALPDVIGLPERDAVGRIEAAALTVEVVRQHNLNVAEGVVFAQLPSQASVAATGTKRSGSLLWLWILLAVIVLAALGGFAYLSLNKKSVPVPNVVGKTQAEAQAAITAAGFKVGAITETPTKDTKVGTVVSQTPAAGASAREGSAVQLDLAVKPAPVPVPNVISFTAADAEAALTAVALVPVQKTAASGSVPKGSVISQNPTAGTKVETGSKVTITVSTGAPVTTTVTVPDVVGQTQKSAVNQITAVGLSSKIVSAPDSSVATGSVSAQSPDGGSAVAEGTTIVLTVSTGPKP